MTDRSPPVTATAMTDDHLLTAYSSLVRWFGDDFCVDLPRDADFDEADVLRNEILRRMSSSHAQRLPDKLDLISIIARNIDCEKECQHAPESCGCAVDAADAILSALTPAMSKGIDNAEDRQ